MATDLFQTLPETLPVTIDQYRLLVEQGKFARATGQIELIYGRMVRMNPQGPFHSDPIDELEYWSHQIADEKFRIRIEKPIEIPELDSSPEPDLVWATNRRYSDRHPLPADIHLLVEVSNFSKPFDRGEKLKLYGEAGIVEYWIVDAVAKTVEVFTQPKSGEYQNIAKYSINQTISPQCLPTASLEITRLFSKS